jgi:hypothetical protein
MQKNHHHPMAKKALSVVAALLIIYGFSILHRDSYSMERLGGILIGVGTLYFIVLLLRSKNPSETDSDR